MKKIKNKITLKRTLAFFIFLVMGIFIASYAFAKTGADSVFEKPAKAIDLAQLDEEVSKALGLKQNIGLSMSGSKDESGRITVHFSNQNITPTEEQLETARKAIEKHKAKPKPKDRLAYLSNQSLFEGLEAGDIAVFSINANSIVPFRKADAADSASIIGVISDNPSDFFKKEGISFPFVSYGFAITKVNLEGGNIKVGNPIGLSSTAGVGKKALLERVIGYALEDYNSGSIDDKILVLLQPSLYQVTMQQAAPQASLTRISEVNGSVIIRLG
ncbi:MAG: hypothetical protein HYW23_01175 [Candidatus Aenigmarchaeota archaeon]|nr:hypothetical protein [Candidatus Aenigmarchaeota archaeon]